MTNIYCLTQDKIRFCSKSLYLCLQVFYMPHFFCINSYIHLFLSLCASQTGFLNAYFSTHVYTVLSRFYFLPFLSFYPLSNAIPRPFETQITPNSSFYSLPSLSFTIPKFIFFVVVGNLIYGFKFMN